ncbi:endonuclease IV [Spiroplasma sp. TIUS-1]|uniref:deoxyribonuclease IV n=1 Tax=Spiroplasma sp. TIUS-1 TaxID=216963 RepID=UPI00139709D2|nr:deoxyribonuclease IV [Spiroplasma sp. TIUS-1]QHX35919.1 endonuclease IV [Spiroplasma sp. TIUS-1]
MSKIYLGSHVSMNKANNYLMGSLKESINYKANTFMIFTGPPQNAFKANPEDLDIPQFRELCKVNNFELEKLVIHAGYLINMANTVKEVTFNYSIDLMVKEIKAAEAIGITNVVLHPGASVGADKNFAISQFVKGLDIVLDRTKGSKVRISLETMSGKGTEICTRFEDFKFIFENLKDNSRVGVCFDTCHMNDAGYDLVGKYEEVIKEFDLLVGLDKLWCIHLNDSKNPLGSKKDRHQNIGYGFIGFDTLHKITHDKRFLDIPIILETPWVNEKKKAPYKEEIEMLYSGEFTKVFSII